jgi:hypothetical protein
MFLKRLLMHPRGFSARLFLVAGLFAAGPFAHADMLFNFNSLSSGAGTSSIQTYMNGVMGCSNCVTVTGAVADRTYNGEGHVTGPGNGSTSLTLGTSDGATASNSNSTTSSYDTFLANTKDNGTQISQQIVMTFSNGHALNGFIGFDYEVFPDISGSPDFIFKAWSGSSLVATFTRLGVTPGTTDGTATHSPSSGSSSSEASQQYIGTWLSSSALSNITELDFIDWPATIGVDNLSISSSTNQSSVPEPGSVMLLASVLAASAASLAARKTR